MPPEAFGLGGLFIAPRVGVKRGQEE